MSNPYGVVYLVVCFTSGKLYVGQTTNRGGADARFRGHIKDARRGSRLYFHKAIRKYGADAFRVITLAEASCRLVLHELERFYIERYRSCNLKFGYNLTHGGEGCSPTQRVKQKLRKQWERPEIRKRHYKQLKDRWASESFRESFRKQMSQHWADPEYKANMREKLKLAMNQPEYKRKMQARTKRMNADPRIKAIISASAKARWSDPKYKARVSQAIKEARRRNPQVFTDKMLRKMSRVGKRVWARKTPQQRAAWSKLLRKALKKRWSDPRVKRSLSDKLKEYYANPEHRKRLGQISKKSWRTRRLNEKTQRTTARQTAIAA